MAKWMFFANAIPSDECERGEPTAGAPIRRRTRTRPASTEGKLGYLSPALIHGRA